MKQEKTSSRFQFTIAGFIRISALLSLLVYVQQTTVWEVETVSEIVCFRSSTGEFITTTTTETVYCFRGSRVVRTVNALNPSTGKVRRLKHNSDPWYEYDRPALGWRTVAYNSATDQLWFREMTSRTWHGDGFEDLDPTKFGPTGCHGVISFPEHNILAFGADRCIDFFDLSTNDHLLRIPVDYGWSGPSDAQEGWANPVVISFSRDRTQLSILEREEIRMWDVDTGIQIPFPKSSDRQLTDLLQCHFWSGGSPIDRSQNEVSVVESNVKLGRIISKGTMYREARTPIDAPYILVASKEGIAKHDNDSFRLKRLYVMHDAKWFRTRIAASHDHIATTHSDGEIRILEMESGRIVLQKHAKHSSMWQLLLVVLVFLWTPGEIYAARKRWINRKHRYEGTYINQGTGNVYRQSN